MGKKFFVASNILPHNAKVKTYLKDTDDLKMAITLRELEGMSYEQIADAMECPIGTVRSRIFRAREAIDKVIKPLMD